MRLPLSFAGSGWADALMHLLWPVSCPVCGHLGRLVCDDCLRALVRPTLPRCLACGKLSPCKTHKKSPRMRAGFVYEGSVRELILALKHGKQEALGRRIGRILAEAFDPPEADALLPVPLHRGSPRRYNQSQALAEGMGEVWNLQVRDAARWKFDASTRAGLSASQRSSLPLDAFTVGGSIRGLRVVLVDDVCTTGTTLSRLARACRNADAEVAEAFVAAWVPA